MFVINPDPFLLPAYRISPFKTDYVGFNSNLPADEFSLQYLNEKFGLGNWMFTFNGREAIKLALDTYSLQPTDVVTILTTSQNLYISSCVTNTIETFCRWNREIVPETKIIFVNHEFGYPYPEMEKLVATGLPIIEDCCTTFYSQDENKKIGKYGDFSLYSLPKFFPIQIGGIIVNNTNSKQLKKSILKPNEITYIQNLVSHQLKKEDILLLKRKENYDYAVTQFSSLGFSPRFGCNESIVPSALLLNNNTIIKDLNALKTLLTLHGIQCSVFYGEDAFFIPIHQNLTRFDLDYFKYHIYSLIN